MKTKDLVGSYHEYVKPMEYVASTDDGETNVIFVPPFNCTVKSIKAYFGTAAISEDTNQAVLTAYYGSGTANAMGSVTIGTVAALGYAEIFDGDQDCAAGTPVWLQYGTVGTGLDIAYGLLDIEYQQGTARTAGTAMP